jgi:excisionase family DNA binding protein
MGTLHAMESEKKAHDETLATVKTAVEQLREQLEDSNKEWLDVKTAAKYLSCTVETVRTYITRGILEGSQLVPKGKWRVTRTSVEKALAGGRVL